MFVLFTSFFLHPIAFLSPCSVQVSFWIRMSDAITMLKGHNRCKGHKFDLLCNSCVI